VERASDGSSDEDDKEDGDHGTSPNNATRTAKRIYKKALKILKFKMYFENFFPTDTEKDSLPYSCWNSAVASIGEINGGPAAAREMFYDAGYEKKVRTSPTVLSIAITLNISPHPPTPSLISISALSGTHLLQSLRTATTDTTAQRRRNPLLLLMTAMPTQVILSVFRNAQ